MSNGHWPGRSAAPADCGYRLGAVVVVTPAEPGHAAAIAVLFEEMDEFYGAAEGGPPEQRVRQIRRVLFDDVRGMSALLAWEDGQLAGAAVYTFLWPATGSRSRCT